MAAGPNLSSDAARSSFRAARDLLASLDEARRVARLYPTGNRVRDACIDALCQNLRRFEAEPVTLRVCDRRVIAGDRAVFDPTADDDWLRCLGAAGVRAMTFGRLAGLPAPTPAELEPLVELLADPRDDDGWVARLWKLEVPWLELRASDATLEPVAPGRVTPSRQLLLPLQPSPTLRSDLRAAVAREVATNLVVRVGTLVVQDLDDDRGDRSDAVRFLASLLEHAMREFEVQGALAILQQAQASDALSEHDIATLTATVQSCVDADWLQHLDETPSGEATIAALVMHASRDVLATIVEHTQPQQRPTLRRALETFARLDVEPFVELLVGPERRARAALEIVLGARTEIDRRLADATFAKAAAAIAIDWLRRDPTTPSRDAIERLRNRVTAAGDRDAIDAVLAARCARDQVDRQLELLRSSDFDGAPEDVRVDALGVVAEHGDEADLETFARGLGGELGWSAADRNRAVAALAATRRPAGDQLLRALGLDPELPR